MCMRIATYGKRHSWIVAFSLNLPGGQLTRFHKDQMIMPWSDSTSKVDVEDLTCQLLTT